MLTDDEVRNFKISLIDLANDGITIRDNSNRLRYANRRFCEMIGYDEQELINRDLRDLIDDNSKIEFKSQIKDRIKGDRSVYEMTFKKKDGALLKALISAAPLEDPNKGSFAIITDITGMKGTVEKYDNLINNMPGMVFRCKYDAHWTMLELNDDCVNLTGYRKDEFLKQEINFDDIIHEDDKEHVRNTIKAFLLSNKHYTVKYRIITREGEIKWVLEKGKGVNIDRKTQEPEFLDGYIVDYTKEKEAEDRQYPSRINDILTQLDQDRIMFYKQAKCSFYFSVGMSFIGALLFSVGVFYTIRGDNTDIMVMSAISGGFMQLFAGTILFLYKKSLSEVNERYNQLIDQFSKLMILQMCDELPEKRKIQMKESLINAFLTMLMPNPEKEPIHEKESQISGSSGNVQSMEHGNGAGERLHHNPNKSMITSDL
ncbi:MAG: PAS domain-containing protein [bacterium]